MPQHRSFPSRVPETTASAPPRNLEIWLDDVTDIIPFNEFGKLDELDFYDNSPFDTATRVLHAPELDDLNDDDELSPLELLVPKEFRALPGEGEDKVAFAYRLRNTDTSDGNADTDIIDMPGRRGHHRKPEPAGAIKGRLVIAAMAAGAAAAAAHSVMNPSDTATAETVLAADESLMTGTVPPAGDGMQVIAVTAAVDPSMHQEELANGLAFQQERAEREARLQRPLFVMPTRGIPTSGFGYRWGVLHGGIDVANSIGTPIYAASDGVVIDVGPTAGYGAWVKIRHSDGTVTLYGHINTWLVTVGEQVMAGDQIATMGNRGNSTGPHLHFEVLLNGTDRIDPTAWLAQRGISV